MSRAKIQSYINLDTLAGGAFAEKLNEALMQVAENIQNPNTDAVSKRGITVNIKFAPNKSRQVVNTTIAVTTKLAATEAIDTQKLVTPAGDVISCEAVKDPAEAQSWGYTPHWSTCDAPDNFRGRAKR